MDKQYSESVLRDLIACNLHLIETGMQLIDKEHYLPNKMGTRGFIDILAKDKAGHLVIVEVKKSDAASREAIHEVFKYLEGVKVNKGLKNEEIRLLIISTDWRELIVPFSSFCQSSDVNIQGYSIEIKEGSSISSIRKVEPILCNSERLFCEHHMLRAYTSAERLQHGIKEHVKAFKVKGIDDYVLLILEAPQGHRERELQAMAAELLQMGIAKENRDDMLRRMAAQYPSYDFIIYSATQLQTEQKYWEIIKTDSDNYEEVLEIIDDYTGENRINTLHDYAIDNVAPIPSCDTAQIGNAAKLEDYIHNQGWTVQKIIRGSILDNEFLDDRMILDELMGAQGRTRQKYFKTFDSQNRAGIVSMKKEIAYCLQDNKQWQVPIRDIVDRLLIETQEKRFRGKIYIYNPMHIIYSIYLMIKDNNIMNRIPYFHIEVKYEESTAFYFGSLAPFKKGIPLDDVLEKHFEYDLYDLALSLTWGGYLQRDLEIVKDLGLKYCVYKVDIAGNKSQFYEYIDYEFTPCDEVVPFEGMLSYLRTETAVVDDIVNLFDDRLPQKGYTFI